MKRLEEIPRRAAEAETAKIEVVSPVIGPPAEWLVEDVGEPLRIAYTQTRVDPDLVARWRRLPGVLGGERSGLVESFKVLRNRLHQRMREDGHRLIGITSPRAVGAKPITALNLALSFAADHDAAVLLVDADLSTTGLQRRLGLAQAPGLADCLAGTASLADCLVNPGIDRFVLLPAGRAPSDQSAELLGTRAAQMVFGEMKRRYADRIIVVDLPPLLDRADALALLPRLDTTLMVIEDHGTTLPDLEEAAELLAPYNLVGTVIAQPMSVADAHAAAASPRPARWPRRPRWLGGR